MASSPPTLLTMVPEMFGKICEYVDFKSIMNLRKVCRDFRNFIEDTKPDIHLIGFTIIVKQEEMYISCACISDTCSIQYKKSGKGCVFVLENGKHIHKKLEGQKAFWNDFKIILSHQKSILWSLEIKICNEEGIDQFYENLKKCFTANPIQVKVKNIEIQVRSQTHVMSILPYLDSMSLEKIELKNGSVNNLDVDLDMDELVHLEQWKRAGEMKTDNLRLTAGLDAFMHFYKINVSLDSLKANELMELKKKFHISPEYVKLDIRYKTSKNIQQFKEKLGRPFLQIGDSCNWHFSLNGGMQTLSIRMTSNCVQFRRFQMKYLDNNHN